MEVKRITCRGVEIILPRPITIPDEYENIYFAVFKSIVEEWNKDIIEFTKANKELEEQLKYEILMNKENG